MTTNETETATPRATRVTTPKLRCIVTGKERLTNKSYLETKAAAAKTDVAGYLSNYISREALRLLRQGKTLAETRAELNATATGDIPSDTLQAAVKLNGKWSKVA